MIAPVGGRYHVLHNLPLEGDNGRDRWPIGNRHMFVLPFHLPFDPLRFFPFRGARTGVSDFMPLDVLLLVLVPALASLA